MMYRVSWEIDIEADSAEAAAREALAIQRKPDSIATVFEVKAEGESESVSVDLTAIDAVTLVMQVVPCADDVEFFPDFAVIQVTPALLERLRSLSAVCAREGLSRVAVDMALDRWAEDSEYSMRGERLEVRGQQFCFAARRKHSGSEVETIDMSIGALLETLGTADAQLPMGWAWRDKTLFAADGLEALEYLQESFASAGTVGGPSS